jgi:hypothetical protein
VTSEIRLFVHISVLSRKDAPASDLDVLASLSESDQRFFFVDVLKRIDQGVPRDQLEKWLKAKGLPFDSDEMDRMAQMDYDDLIEHIVLRYPGRLLPS